MQYSIELDPQTEKNLNNYLLNSGETETTILAYAVKDFLQQHLKQRSLEQKLKPFELNLDGFQFNREQANER